MEARWLVAHPIEQQHVNLVRGAIVVARVPEHLRDDAFQEGCLGLIDAAGKYDPSAGATFTTYAGIRIRGAILDYLRNQDLLSRSTRCMIKEIESAEMAAQSSAQPADEQQLADTVGISLERLRKYRQLAADTYGGTDELATNDSGEELVPANVSDPFIETARHETSIIVRRAIAQLPERERRVMTLYYLHGLTMLEAAGVMGVTESRVSQLHTQAVLLLRQMLRSRDLPEPMHGPDLVDEFEYLKPHAPAPQEEHTESAEPVIETAEKTMRRPLVRTCQWTGCGIEFTWQPPPVGGRVPKYCETHRYSKRHALEGVERRERSQQMQQAQNEQQKPIEVQLPTVAAPYVPQPASAHDYASVLADMEAKRDALNEAIAALRHAAQLVGLPHPAATAALRSMGAAA